MVVDRWLVRKMLIVVPWQNPRPSKTLRPKRLGGPNRQRFYGRSYIPSPGIHRTDTGPVDRGYADFREFLEGELPRTPLLRTQVNKGKGKGQGLAAPALRLVGV